MPIPPPNSLRDEYLLIDGHCVFVRRGGGGGGGGPLIVFLHGIGMSGSYFIPLASRLAKIAEVIVLDLPGFGRSEHPSDVYSLSQHARLVAALLQQEGSSREVVLVGHSMGCQVIRELLSLVSGDQLTIVLIAPTVNPAEKNIGLQWLRLLQDMPHEPLWFILMLMRNYLRCGPRMYLGSLRFMFAQDSQTSWPACSAARVVVGKNDPIAPLAWATQLTGFVPGAHLVKLSGGHAPQVTDLEGVAEVCESLIVQP